MLKEWRARLNKTPNTFQMDEGTRVIQQLSFTYQLVFSMNSSLQRTRRFEEGAILAGPLIKLWVDVLSSDRVTPENYPTPEQEPYHTINSLCICEGSAHFIFHPVDKSLPTFHMLHISTLNTPGQNWEMSTSSVAVVQFTPYQLIGKNWLTILVFMQQNFQP